MTVIKNISNIIEKFSVLFIVLSLVAMTAVTFIQVIFRYVFFYSLPWSEEFSRYCLIWLTYIGGSLGLKKGVHVAVEALVINLPYRIKEIFKKISYILLIILSFFLVVYGINLSNSNMPQLSPSMHIPIGIIYLAIPIGSLFAIIHLLSMLLTKEGEIK
ncbi:MAG: TRAP transporter small permease [Thermoanaerobacteraceae bacterium]|nr:TRAP transporter small permease [Thermoanaerobacteraceae bacterium]